MRHIILLLLFNLTSVIILSLAPAHASIKDLKYFVDNRSVHIMWRAYNDGMAETKIELNGPFSKKYKTKNSFIRIDDLTSGHYSIIVIQNNDKKTINIDISSDQIEKSTYETGELDHIDFIEIDDTLHPNLNLKFRAFDSQGTPLLNLQKEQFSIQETPTETNKKRFIDDLIDFFSKLISIFDFMPPDSSQVNRIADIVVLFDVTDTMDVHFNALKQNIDSFVDKLIQNGVQPRFRLITFDDSPYDQWDWTDDSEEFKQQINSLQAGGGGFWNEDGFGALEIAADYDFRPGAQKVFLFISDAPSWEDEEHEENPTPITKSQIIDILQKRNITVFAVASELNHFNQQYKGENSITNETGGQYFSISSEFSGVVENIGATIGNVYHLSYETQNPYSVDYNITIQYNLDADNENEQLRKTINTRSNVVKKSKRYTRLNRPRINILYSEITPSPQEFNPGDKVNIPVIVFGNISEVKLRYLKNNENGYYWKIAEKTLEDKDNHIKATFSIQSDFEQKVVVYKILAKDENKYITFSPKRVSQPYTYPSKLTTKVIDKEIDEENLSLKVKLQTAGYSDKSKLIFFYQIIKKTTIPSTIKRIPDENTSDLNGGVYDFKFSKELLFSYEAVGIKIVTKFDNEMDKTDQILYNANVREYVRRKADTIILTNLSKFDEQDDIPKLKESIQNLIKKTWNIKSDIPFAMNNYKYNMLPIIVRLDDEPIFSSGASGTLSNKFEVSIEAKYNESWDSDSDSQFRSNASVIKTLLKSIVKKKYRYNNLRYLLIIGYHDVIPFGVATNKINIEKLNDDKPDNDNTFDEKKWFNKYLKDILPEYSKLYINHSFPSDSIYRKSFSTGRLLESPGQISSIIDNYLNKKGYLLKSKKIVFFGGYDHHNKQDGYFLTDKLVNFPFNAFGWNSKSMHNPKGFGGKTVVQEINKINSGLIYFSPHGHYSSINFSKGNDKFFAGRKILKGDVLELNSLKDNMIFSNSCHTGYNFHSDKTSYESYTLKYPDFPEAYVNDAGKIEENRSLAVLIAPSTYTSYYTDVLGYCDTFIYNGITNMLIGIHDGIIYNSVFKNFHSMQLLADTDIIDRFQYYGIPNYRLNQVENTRKNIRSEKVIKNISGISFLNFNSRNYCNQTHKFNINNNKIILTIQYDITGKYLFDNKTGKLLIYGIQDSDKYSRPLISIADPIPNNCTVTNIEILDEQFDEFSYVNFLNNKFCNSLECADISIESSNNYGYLPIIDFFINDDKLLINCTPIQYKANTNQARVVKKFTVIFEITFPSYIEDNDKDGLPDYWEQIYGLDYESDKNINGPEGDPDEDGKSNIEEYIEFSNPIIPIEIENDFTPSIAPIISQVTPIENGAIIKFTTDNDVDSIQFYYGTIANEWTDSSPILQVGNTIGLFDLKDNTLYYAIARSFDIAGNISEPSEMFSFQTPVGKGPKLVTQPIVKGEMIIIENPIDNDFSGYILKSSQYYNLSEVSSTYIPKDENNSTIIIVSPYFVSFGVDTVYFQITAVDDNNHEGNPSDILSIMSSNGSPTAYAGEDQHVETNETILLDASSSSDMLGITKYFWEQLSGTIVNTSNPNATQLTVFSPESCSGDDILLFQLTVTNINGLTATDSCSITINCPNKPPVANAGNNQTVSDGQLVLLDATLSNDPDNEIISFSWEQISGLPVSLTSTTENRVTFIAPDPCPGSVSLQFQLTVTDSEGLTSSNTSSITVICSNHQPIADAGEDQVVSQTVQVTLNAYSSIDNDGIIETVFWEQTNGLSVHLSDNGLMNPTFIAPEICPENERTLTFQLTVTDNDQLSSMDTCNVIILCNNNPPVADAGPDQTVNQKTKVILDASSSFDQDGQIVRYLWKQIAGTKIIVSNPTSQKTSIITPEICPKEELLTFNLIVTDNYGLTSTDFCIVNTTCSQSAPNNITITNNDKRCFINTIQYNSFDLNDIYNYFFLEFFNDDK